MVLLDPLYTGSSITGLERNIHGSPRGLSRGCYRDAIRRARSFKRRRGKEKQKKISLR
jgi:hypothetical protein